MKDIDNQGGFINIMTNIDFMVGVVIFIVIVGFLYNTFFNGED